MFGALYTLVFCCDLPHLLILWSTLMLIGRVVRIRASPPRAMLCSSGTISSPGPPSIKAPSQDPMQKPSIAQWLMVSLRPPGCVNSCRSCTPPLRQATLVYCDNISAVYMTSNPVQHQRTKHVEIDLHFVRERVSIGDLRVLHMPTSSQYADIFTKGLPSSVFTEFRSSLNVQSG